MTNTVLGHQPLNRLGVSGFDFCAVASLAFFCCRNCQTIKSEDGKPFCCVQALEADQANGMEPSARPLVVVVEEAESVDSLILQDLILVISEVQMPAFLL